MQIKLAQNCGFCFGVKRAMEKAEEVLKNKSNDDDIYSLGPLIHNPQVVAHLKEKGIEIVSNIEKLNQGTLIIRSHGVPPNIIDKAVKKGLKIIDATCPFVKFAQDICCLLREEKYQIIIIGEACHPEVKALVGFAGENSIVIKSKQDIDFSSLESKIGILSQTTQPKDNVREIIKYISEHHFKEMRVFETICDATSKQQKAALEIAKDVDVMIVIGGYNSSNTKKLAALCADKVVTHHIESKDDLKKEWFAGKKIAGITAGASTPQWIIDETMEELKRV